MGQSEAEAWAVAQAVLIILGLMRLMPRLGLRLSRADVEAYAEAVA